MKHDYTLTAVVRTELGKGASRRLRRANERVAGIIYGGETAPMPIAIDKPALYKAIEDESFYSSIITINVDGKAEKVVVRDLQRHPFKAVLLHADFMRVNANEEITLTVQLHVINEENCKGVKVDGGELHIQNTDIAISCLPQNIPDHLEVDVADLGVGETIHLSGLKLPAGVTAVELSHGDDHDQPLVSVHRVADHSEAEGEEGDAPAADSAAE
ncbi:MULTISPECIES: 50S ribosomal protein L25/general stress protein Ctc [unclassified Zymobacter]|uniref:50S ribosomal protein L25/general stress protein Ctc n=1 Tax=unclassified Zymobacter TaxID=3048685 RepID=UPI0039C31A3B